MNPWGSVCRVYDRHGTAHVRTLGSTDPEQAAELKAFARWLRMKRQWDALDLVIARAATIADLHDAHVAGRLTDAVALLRRKADDPDLEPLVAEWNGRGPKRRDAKYVTHVRALIPAGKPFPRSRFNKRELNAFLAALLVSDPTKTRYRAALMAFGHALVEREILDHNPVRDTRGYGQSEARDKWLTTEQARGVVNAASDPLARSFLALLYGSGAEFGAAHRVQRSDIDERARTVHLRGTKTRWRNRVVRVEDWAWDAFWKPWRGAVGNPALYREAFGHVTARARHNDALAARGLSGYRLHDARHSYAVNALRKGYDEQVVAHQLGHKDATMVRSIYGKYVPQAEDYLPRRTLATKSASSAKGRR